MLAGAICASVANGLIGDLVTFLLLSFGLCAAVLLVFLEVGLSEDRDRRLDAERRAQAERHSADLKHPPRRRLSRPPRRPG